MRKEFSNWLETTAGAQKNIVFLTGDLGFSAFEKAREILGTRFVNCGVSEQNMISVAAGLAHQGITPLCYSIAPFTVFRPAEQIRLDVCLHKKNVKIVGNGGGYGYGIMGATHHAIEDLAVMASFQNMTCYVPFCNEDVIAVCNAMINQVGPSYLRLGFGSLPNMEIDLKNYCAIRKIASGNRCTIVGIGPVILNALKAIKPDEADVFVVSELPLPKLPELLLESLARTRKLVVIEEHVQHGGLGSAMALKLLEHKKINVAFFHAFAAGYPGGRYGSQAYHQKKSSLDVESLRSSIDSFAEN